MTLLELRNHLVEKGFPDLFDFQVDGDILSIDEMKGSVADYEGDEESGHLNTIIEIEE